MRYSVDIEQAETGAVSGHRHVLIRYRGWQLQDEEWRDLLGWRRFTHEVGLAISHSGFHKHGAYVLTHSDMADLPGRSSDSATLVSVTAVNCGNAV